jgi:hypothetical protein
MPPDRGMILPSVDTTADRQYTARCAERQSCSIKNMMPAVKVDGQEFRTSVKRRVQARDASSPTACFAAPSGLLSSLG